MSSSTRTPSPPRRSEDERRPSVDEPRRPLNHGGAPRPALRTAWEAHRAAAAGEEQERREQKAARRRNLWGYGGTGAIFMLVAQATGSDWFLWIAILFLYGWAWELWKRQP